MMDTTINAPLIENFMVPCVMMNRDRQQDPLGGWVNVWTEGAPFMAAIVKDTSLAARVAEKQGVTEVYTVTTRVGLGLDFHEVFKRVKDGTIFRVTSNSEDSATPSVASFQFEKVSAERWELT